MRDCRFSKDIWQHIGFNNSGFFAYEDIEDWIKDGTKGPNSTTFAAGLWWVWLNRNSMTINNEEMSIHRVAANIRNSADNILQAFPPNQAVQMERYVRWNNRNFDCNILNVDGSSLGSPARAGFGGLIRNNAGYYLTGFSGFLPTSTDILEAELSAIYFGLTTVKNIGFAPVACYTDSILAIHTIKEASSKFHVNAVLIHAIQELLSQENVTLHHTLCEGNQCADFLAKLGASSDDVLLEHPQPPAA